MTVSDTDAGQVVNEELLNARKKFEEELDALKTEWKAASDEKDVEMVRILEEERKHTEEKLQQVKAEQEEFRRVQIEEMRQKNEELQNKIDKAHSSGRWFTLLTKVLVGGVATFAGVPAPLAVALASAI
jgi:Skp family chaperone for outer membrane proteins